MNYVLSMAGISQIFQKAIIMLTVLTVRIFYILIYLVKIMFGYQEIILI